MRIFFKYEWKNLIWFGVFLAIALMMFVQVNVAWWTLLFAPALFVVCNLRIHAVGRFAALLTGFMMVLGAVMNTFLVQYLLLDAEDFSKTKDMKLFLNVLVCLSLYLLIYACSTSVLASCMSSYIFWCILGFVNYYVYFFRQNEFYFADLRSVGTGLSVAGQYAISLSDKGCYVILAGILYLVLVCRIKTEIAVRWQASLLGLLGMIGCMLLVGIESADVNTETWEQKGTYRNGYFLNFVLSARDSYVGKPEDYSVEELTELEAKYLKKQPKMSSTKVAGAMSDASGVANGSVQDPAIIVIMNESFADLETIGPLDTNEEVMPFYDSLQENTVKGYALSSVFGAKTPNSEWEFLAGGSMAFLPGGSVVYQQYLDDQPVTLVNVLQSMDYTCVSMHPYYATGWSRNLVYPNIGFDESYFIEDFDRKDLCREYITDEEVYRKVIERYENRQVNEKLFIMGITMQNHGGYTTTYENFPEPVYKLGPSYTDANQYLSLVRKSDDALSEFIAYFREVEEPVVVVFFGDHQPSLSKEFYPILNGKGTTGLSEEEMQKLFMLPFLIWTNYDSPEQEVELTSLNYLSTMALEQAGISLPPYYQFLSDMQECIPAMNARSYYSKSLGTYQEFEYATGEEAMWLHQYEMLQYNGMFDREHRSEVFYSY